MAVKSADKHGAAAPRLLDGVRTRFRARHYSLRTEYLHWNNRFIFFRDHLHPRAMGGRWSRNFPCIRCEGSCFVIDAKSSFSRAAFSLLGSAVR